MLAESYIHNLDPFIFQFTETLGLRWYGLAYICGFLVGWQILKTMSNKGFSPITKQQAGDVVFSSILGVIIGGRVGYALFYDPNLFVTTSNNFPWWQLLAINNGGMSSHGGMIGVLCVFIYFGKKHTIQIPHIMDICSYAAIPGLFFGRIANFINAELWGKSLPATLQQNPPWWSVKYPTEITEVWLSEPVVYETKLLALEPLNTAVIGSNSFYTNIVAEANAGNTAVIETIQPLLTAWYPSQLFQAISNGPILFITLTLVWWSPRKPGVISGWFLLLYGVFRILTEIFRQPDVGVSLFFGLSRGQLLSVLMVSAGVVLIVCFSKLKSEKLGGFKSIFNS